MNARDAMGWARDTALRMLPHATAPGLRRVGAPGRRAPVILTCNFTLTVRRVLAVLRGHDAWVLVANSKGVNVWCAAGGGLLTHHDVVAAIRTSGIDAQVDLRELVLPQLGATGVEREAVTRATGWKTRWGPARLEDLPDYLDRGRRVRPEQRLMRFPLWERLEMATTWWLPISAVAFLLVTWATSALVGAVVASAIAAGILGVFALLPLLRINGAAGWLTRLALSLLIFGGAAAALAWLGRLDGWTLGVTGAAVALAVAVQSVDFAGTTPWYPSSINTTGNRFHIELVPGACTGAAQCVLVCPRGVLRMQGKRRKVVLDREDLCIRCGACIVQCPGDALRFRREDGRVVEAAAVRSTRVNMLGRRTIRLRAPRSETPGPGQGEKQA